MVYNTLFGFAGWSIIPDFATRHALTFFHRFYPNVFGVPHPSPGTPAYRQHYRYTFAMVVLGYLLYTLVEGSRSMEPNFYEILGVPPDVDENGLKLAFRQFAKRYHPDRPEVGPKGAAMFIAVRDAFEALKNPTVRFAYDRCLTFVWINKIRVGGVGEAVGTLGIEDCASKGLCPI
ncbi:DnaJ-domain-containing protein [Dendrothele bispora CBS 962.96]|uniref:DnaJ-domain-containing protein n=1 Tax=Dendrothele bispora (strain CBS 962.96) TaxID=1314807 RepID=A0A4S8LLC0_DENBC|nr:DnaJ-domain-containing protein [Dendrothele bispora CBS 962.96]